MKFALALLAIGSQAVKLEEFFAANQDFYVTYENFAARQEESMDAFINAVGQHIGAGEDEGEAFVEYIDGMNNGLLMLDSVYEQFNDYLMTRTPESELRTNYWSDEANDVDDVIDEVIDDILEGDE